MAVNSKDKGNNFERKVAKALSTRFAEKTGLTDSFRRNIDSGSFFGKTNQSRIESHGVENACFGDLMAPSTFKFNVECKHYKAPPSLNAIIKQDWKILDEWIEQAKQDSENANKSWIIVVKFNNIDEFVVVEKPVPDTVILYKGFSIVPLKAFLKNPDDFFFKE